MLSHASSDHKAPDTETVASRENPYLGRVNNFPANGPAFTAEEDALIRRDFMARISPSVTAKKLKIRSRGSVLSRRAKLGLVWPKEDAVRERIIERIQEGWRPSRVARQYGVSLDLIEVLSDPDFRVPGASKLRSNRYKMGEDA